MSKHQIIYLGRIVDQKRQAPIAGAKVSLKCGGNSFVNYTDIEGIYRFAVNSSNNNIQAQLIIEANGYKIYNSMVKLSPKQKDLGDIKLFELNSTQHYHTSSSPSSPSTPSTPSRYPQTENNIPLPIIITLIAALCMMTLIAIQTSFQKTPTNRRNDSINIYQP